MLDRTLTENGRSDSTPVARLLSVNIGLPRDVAWRGRTVHTGVWKTPVQGRRMVRRLNIDGDGQGDLAGHGGEHRAVLVYQLESYHHWQTHLGRDALPYGQFGENFTVEGLADREVCIGDRYRIGEALFEVSQPRVTCYRLGIRMDEPQMAALLVAHGRPGFYLRVIEEGHVEAGDGIVRVAEGAERMTVAEIDALLYTSVHPQSELERALRVAALSAGWRASFAALLDQQRSGAAGGNAGLAPPAGPAPAWSGFRPLRVTGKIRESRGVVSLVLEPVDRIPLARPLPGQFIVLRLKSSPDATTLLRSYSLSADPAAERYRVSVKREPHGAASAYIDDQLRVGDTVEASAARGSFVLRPGDDPVVLLSAGIGATPVLAMLHALATTTPEREVWWLYGARDRGEHPFAAEARAILGKMPHAHARVLYSAPGPDDRPGVDFDAAGRLDINVLRDLDVPHHADFYICGPAAFMRDLTAGLAAWGVATSGIHTEIFGARGSITPGVAPAPVRPPHLPSPQPAAGPLVTFARSGLAVHWGAGEYQSLLELAEACDVPVRWSCRTGVCHSCETGLVSGTVDYESEPIDPPADGNTLICCCRPRDDVVVDL
jgi:ferredoxin-NADP reductase/MOSC domain-containing protein YiiM